MLILNKSFCINRLLIILICNNIYDNASKLNLLLTCKFLYDRRLDILFYQEAEAPRNKTIRGAFTKIKITKKFTKLCSFKNVTSIYINVSNCKKIIKYLPPKLVKLEIFNKNISIRYKISLPKTLKVLRLESEQNIQNNFFNEGLQRLTMNAKFTYDFIKLPSTLIYLKLLGNFNLDYIRYELTNGVPLPPFLSCFILDVDYFDVAFIPTLPDSIKHFGLYTKHEHDVNSVKRIISQNIIHFEFDQCDWFDILHRYPLIKKITNHGDDFNHDRVIIPLFISKIKPSVTTLNLNFYLNSFNKYIPSTIKILKICNFKISLSLPNKINELHIKKIIESSNKLLQIPNNIKKLIISYDDKHLINLNNNPECVVMYKY